MKYSKKNLYTLTILFIAIQIAVTAVLYYQTEKKKEQHIVESLKELHLKISSVKKSYHLMTTALFSSYIKRGDLAKLMAIATKEPSRRHQIRERLLKDMGAHFNDLSNFKLVQMQLHLPDGTSLLRFHAPDYHSDNLINIRPTIRKIHQEKMPIESFEIGRFFIGFRYLMPIMEKDKYVGCLELGIAYREFNEELSKILNVDFLFLIKGSELDKLTLTRHKDSYTKSMIGDDLYISASDNYLINKQDPEDTYIKTLVDNNREHITKKLNQEISFIFYDNIGVDYYLGALIPVKDIEGSTKAYFAVFAKDSILSSLQSSFFIKTILLTITIFAIVAYVFSMKKSRDYMTEKNTLIKESMKRVKEHNMFLKTIIDSIPYPFYVVDVSNYKIVLMNATALKDKTIKEGEETCYRLSHNSDTPCNSTDHSCPIENIVKTGETQVLEHIHFTEEGEPCYVEVHAVPVWDSSGKLLNMIEYYIDITEKKKTEEYMKKAKEAAEEASYMKSRFLANVSHEIRTPLNGIIGMIDFLLHSSLTEEQKEYAETAHKSASMLLSIVNDILDFSKIESGKMDIESVVFDTRYLFEEAISIFEHDARKKGLLLECIVDEKIPHKLIGDPLRTKQVLLNLLSNALKFTPQGKITLNAALVEITSTERSSKALIRLTVSDTGIGIPEDKREAIFESFNQVDASTTRRFGGTGLGLSITRDIVNLMGGNIWFKSEVNLGSTFFCTIPFEIPSTQEEDTKDEPLNNNSESMGSTENQEAMDILVVEDNVVNQKIMETLLKKRGHRVYLADSEDSAIRLFKENKFDLVLMDIELPENDGFSVANKIRAMEEDYKTPIAAITAHVSEYYKNRCLEAGMCDYLSKPIDVRKIDALLAKLKIQKRQGAS